MQIYAGTQALDAHFEVDYVDSEPTVVWRSRGGRPVRNADYNEGLELILERLGSLGATLTSVVVDSAQTRRSALSFEERQLTAGDGTSFPITLASLEDIAALRGALGASQAGIGRLPHASGSGNYTKQIRLYLAFEDVPLTRVELENALAFGSRVLIVALPRSASRNLEWGLEHGIWGFPAPRFAATENERVADYKLLQRGDTVLLLSGYTGGSPRASAEAWRAAPDGTPREFADCYWCVVSEPYFYDPTPFWPDELETGEKRYPHRIGIDPSSVGAVSLQPGRHLSAEAIEAVRRSHLQGAQGFTVETTGSPLLAAIDPSGTASVPSPKTSRPRGQRDSLDPIRRKRVEERAVLLARARYENDGWTVEDVSIRNDETEGTPYDLRCAKDGTVRHVEVKGTSGSGETVRLSANERKHAESEKAGAESYLFVAEQIGLRTTRGEVVARGGSVRYDGPFDVHPTRFVATQFRYSVPSAEARSSSDDAAGLDAAAAEAGDA